MTVELFDEGLYRKQLALYGLAHQAGRFITRERAENDALALEQALHDLRGSVHEHHKHMAIAVPPYLQHLLHAVSEAHETEVFRYDAMIECLLRLPYVFFVTLNYDVLLDRRLNGHHLLSTFDDYISRDKNWSLIKPHGSVNWWHPTDVGFAPDLPPPDLQWDTSQFACVAPNAKLEDVRGAHLGFHTHRYPALALPEGPDDALVLPTSHTEFMAGFLGSLQEIDILVIGYSGLDKQVLRVVGGGDLRVRRMTVVSRDLTEAETVLERFHEAGIEPIWPNLVDGDFATWADGGGFQQLVDEFGGPYGTGSAG